MGKKDIKRLFCAVKVPLSEPLSEAIERYQQALGGEDIKWVNPHNLHITLKFFGPTHVDSIGDISAALHKAAATYPPFSFTVESSGTFGSSRFPRVIWLGIGNPDSLSSLYNEVNAQLKPRGFTPDKSIFSPHLTIGRIKHINNLNALFSVEGELAGEEFSKVKVSNFYLFESLLRPQGPEYKVVEAFELGEGHRA